MLVVISSPGSPTEEVKAVKALLEEGMEIFHVRKPQWTENQVRNFLQKFTAGERSHMVMHRLPALQKDLEMKGYHFSTEELEHPEQVQQAAGELDKREQTASASFHQFAEAERYPVLFDYVFLSPVFDSISKSGYLQNSSLQNLKGNLKQTPLALGGIDAFTIPKLAESGYAGAALLGALWQQFDGNIHELKKKFRMLKQLAPGKDRSKNGTGQALPPDNSRI